MNFQTPKSILCSAGKGEMETGACLACALSASPPCGYDYLVLSKLYRESHRPEIHVSDLLGCPKKAFLDKRAPQPEYPHEKLARTLGTAVHSFFEIQDEHLESELELSGLGIVGRADAVYKNGRIIDLKTTRWIYPDKLPYASHALQVNVYAYLLKQQGREVTSLAIQYIDMSGPSKCRKCKRAVRMTAGVLACPVCGETPRGAHLGAVLVEVPLMDAGEIEGMLVEKRDRLAFALDIDIAPLGEPGFLCAYCNHVDICPEGLKE